MNNKTVLLVDDNSAEKLLVSSALHEAAENVTLHYAGDGEKGLAYLSMATNPRPDFMLVDINMPCMSGFEFLARVSQNPNYASIPVVMYSTSFDSTDIEKARALGATNYLVKPGNYDCLSHALKALVNPDNEERILMQTEFVIGMPVEQD